MPLNPGSVTCNRICYDLLTLSSGTASAMPSKCTKSNSLASNGRRVVKLYSRGSQVGEVVQIQAGVKDDLQIALHPFDSASYRRMEDPQGNLDVD